jgi:endonuclease YncB( thermonuclease family)
MKRYSACTLFLTLIICIGTTQDVKAASLFGKVIEVNDGDVITVFNLNRPVRVQLIGVDAPEKDQPFGDVAKQHLSDLVYGKLVSVEYSGLGQNSSLIGRVLLNDLDVGAQMIRDGVAWYNPNYQSRLTPAVLDVYVQSEQAARSERRGLWQVDHPIAPWEFVKGQLSSRNVLASAPQKPAPNSANPPGQSPTKETLLSSEMASGALLASSRSSITNRAVSAPASSWQRFQPTGENFSVLVPSGTQATKTVPFGDQTIKVNYYMAHDGWTVYSLMWATGPTNGETHAVAINGTLSGFLRGVGAGYESVGGKFSCEPRSDSDISLNGYSGREFDLKDCTIPAMARVYTKVVGGQRQMYIAVVFYGKDQTNVSKFLESFTVNDATNGKRAAR